MSSSVTWRSGNESSENRPSSSTVHRKEAKQIEIDGREDIWSVAFLTDGKHVVSGGEEGKIRRWRVEDGKEAGKPMDARNTVCNIAVSRDGKWVVCGTISAQVVVFNAERREKVAEFGGHYSWVRAVDVSPDATRLATGSNDWTASVWTLLTGRPLLSQLRHDDWVVAVKYSPDGRFIATATWSCPSVRIYDSNNGDLLVDVQIRVGSSWNQSLAWASNSERLFALSREGNIHCIDASTGMTISQWPIQSCNDPTCIVLASNATFIAACDKDLVSFWDTTTHEQIGSVIEHTADVMAMAISANNDLVICGGKKILLRNICDLLPSSYYEDTFPERAMQRVGVETLDPEETIRSLRAQEEESKSKIAHLEETVQQLRKQLSDSQLAANEREDILNETIKSLRADLGARDKSSDREIVRLRRTVQELRNELADSQNKTNSLVQILRVHEQKRLCEALYAEGRIIDAAVSLLEITDTVSEEVKTDESIVNWLTEFTSRCVSTLESIGDQAWNVERPNKALAAYSTALSLSPSTPNTLLTKWARRMLIDGTVHEAWPVVAKFKLPKFVVYRVICDILEGGGRITEAIECFQHMRSELPEDTSTDDERAQWELDFRRRCVEKLEKLGDIAMNSGSYDAAIKQYSDTLALDPTNQSEIFFKRSKARAVMGSWEESLIDADRVIELDPSSYKGYERKHAALQQMGRYGEAFEAFKIMLSKLEQSPDPHIRELRHQFVDATPTIRRMIEQTIRDMPRVLIDTATGHLHDREKQKEAFEKLPIYDELRSSMTTRVDLARIRMEVKKYYQYVMFSHKWENGEPLFQRVQNISVYELETSSPNIKLQTLCTLVRSLGFQWVWSDTCCIDKKDNVVLQESLVAMFTWYRGSSLTIVYLRGIWSEFQQPGDLRESIWNTRAWTYQEYIAAEIIQFYTEDWKPYLGLDMFNHKKSPAILSEMQQVVAVSTQELAVLRPGLERVREKLYLASTRQTTLVEDIAYSLLGILNVAIPVIYGEGNRAVGRLLEHILTGSGDVTILAWTGRAGSYNSCLPPDLTVYNQLIPSHVPQPIEAAEMVSMVTTLRSSLPDLSLVVVLYDRLNGLPSPSVAASRLRLPCIVFPVPKLVHPSESQSDSNFDLRVYSATATTLGDVEIKTTEDLSGMEEFVLIHPWISALLDQQFASRAAGFDDITRALRLVAHLRQPFGALLLAPVSRVQYRRVAADCLIMVQVREDISLGELIKGIRTVDIQ